MLLHCNAHIRVSGQWILSTASTVLDRRPELKMYHGEIIFGLDLNTGKRNE